MIYKFNIRSKEYFIRLIDPVLDTEPYFAYITDENVARFINAVAYVAIDEARKDLYYFSLFDGVRHLCLGITNEFGELIGTVGYNYVDNSGVYEVVGDLGFRYWGRGIMKYVGLFLMDYCRSLGIVKLYAKVLIENKRAMNLLSKFGCNIIEMQEQNGKDCYLYSLDIK